MNTTHTAGPWEVDPTGDIGEWSIGTHEWQVCEIVTDMPESTWKANARLIAAAPNMKSELEANLQAMLHMGWAVSTDPRLRERYEHTQAAIAKAEG